MKQFLSQVIGNKQVGADFFEMALSWDANAPAPKPGQFLTVRSSGDTVPLLRRPFAFSGFDEASGAISIIYQKRGRGTEILSAKQPGERVDIIGPLGKPFPTDGKQGKTVAVAGGIGIGPILFLVNRLRERGNDAEFVFGCKNELYIPNIGAFKNAAPKICTDNGTAGFKGNVVQYVENNIKLDNKTVVYACGPVIMLENLCKLTKAASAPTWVSLESVMACGVGACMGCVAPTTAGYLRVCKDGPVFDGRDIQWDLM